MVPITPRSNLHTVFQHAGILCLRCKSCQHRRTLQIGAQGDMRPIETLRFKCSQCDARDIEVQLPFDYAEAMRFLKEVD